MRVTPNCGEAELQLSLAHHMPTALEIPPSAYLM